MAMTDLKGAEVAEAGHCKEVEECYRPAARRLVGRVSRQFLDQANLTPSELLANPVYQQRFMDSGQHLQRAVQVLSGAQSRAFNLDLHKRMRALFQLGDGILEATKAVSEKVDDINISPGGLAASLNSAASRVDGAKRDMATCAVMTNYLADAESWDEKLDRLLTLAESEPQGPLVAFIDGFVADIIDSSAAMKTLLGESANVLRDRLVELIALYHGTYPPEHVEVAPDLAIRLNALLAQHPMEISRVAIIEQVLRAMEMGAPVTRSAGLDELMALCELYELMKTEDDILGGRDMAEAIHKRMSRQVEHDNLAMLLQDKETVTEKIGALMQLHGRVLGTANARQIAEYVKFQFERRTFAAELMQEGEGTSGKLKVVARLWMYLRKSDMNDSLKERLMVQLEEIQMNYIKEQKIFAKISSQCKTTSETVMRLLELCRSGLFTGGKNLLYVHSLIKHQIGQSDFMKSYLAGVTDAETRTKKLAILRKRLNEAGIRDLPGQKPKQPSPAQDTAA